MPGLRDFVHPAHSPRGNLRTVAGQKKGPRCRGPREKGGWESDRFRQLHAVEFDRVGVVALVLVLAVALVDHVVDLVHQQVDGFVHLLGVGRAVDVRPAKLDMGLGDELVGDVMLAIALQFDADPHDVSLVPEKSLRLLLHVVLQGGGELEVDTGHNDFVGFVVVVHGFSFGLTDTKGAEREQSPRLRRS